MPKSRLARVGMKALARYVLDNSLLLLAGTITAVTWANLARLPQGLLLADLVVVGITASVGFTVSLFFATTAFPAGAALAETKMGALLSFAAAPLALIASRLLRRRDT